jgi:hypothetical protein
MKSSDETISWIFESIQNAYDHPTLYGCTRRSLSSVLWAYHSAWAFVVGRQAEFRNACIESLGGTNTDSHIIGESDQARDIADFAAVIQQWKWIDERLGVDLSSRRGNEP